MYCPACGGDHVHNAQELLTTRYDLFSPCPDCNRIIRNKSGPPDDTSPPLCHCGKAFIDDVYARLYRLLTDAGIFSGNEPLSAVGIPLIDPGIFLRAPPFLPHRSLLLISSVFDEETACHAYHEIPQISGILQGGDHVPGIGDRTDDSEPVCSELKLLCGCDVRADFFPTSKGPAVVYKKQGAAHIEFPHAINPKIRSVESAIQKIHPSLFVDACCGVGTLGITSGILGVHHILLNDPWYAAAFFSAFNLLVNKKTMGLDECVFTTDLTHLTQEKIHEEPLPIAVGYGPESLVEVFQGRMELLSSRITDRSVLTVFDPFDKNQFKQNRSFLSVWQKTVGGEVFIP